MSNVVMIRKPVVFVVDGEVLADSRDVAAYFAKRHDNVLRDIDKLIASDPVLWRRNFEAFTVEGGTTSYCMDRDGFVLLAGCWTSGKLVPSKVAYIEAFAAAEVKPTAPPADVEALVEKIDELMARHEELMARYLALNAKGKVFDDIMAAEPSLCLEEAAATLHMPRHVLTRYLLVDGWAYCRAGREGLRGYAHTIKHGLLENVEHRARKMFGGERIVIEMRITRKGLTKLAAACQHSALLRNWMKPAAAE